MVIVGAGASCLSRLFFHAVGIGDYPWFGVYCFKCSCTLVRTRGSFTWRIVTEYCAEQLLGVEWRGQPVSPRTNGRYQHRRTCCFCLYAVSNFHWCQEHVVAVSRWSRSLTKRLVEWRRFLSSLSFKFLIKCVDNPPSLWSVAWKPIKLRSARTCKWPLSYPWLTAYGHDKLASIRSYSHRRHQAPARRASRRNLRVTDTTTSLLYSVADPNWPRQ